MKPPSTDNGTAQTGARQVRVSEPPSPPAAPRSAREAVQEAIEHAAHLLPAQGPITVFVHHNTLHSFENMRFADAVERGREVYGCHPYLPEKDYRDMLVTGRIRPADLRAVLKAELGRDEPLEVSGQNRLELRLAMLGGALPSGSDSQVQWLMAETDALVRFEASTPEAVRTISIEGTRRWVMRDLSAEPARAGEHVRATLERLKRSHGAPEHWSEPAWEAATLELTWCIASHRCRTTRAPARSPGKAAPELRDLVRHMTGTDVKELVDDVLIRFCMTYLDQGFANWALPFRESGFFRAFLDLYHGTIPVEAWLRELPGEVGRIRRSGMGALESILESLDLLGIPAAESEGYVTRSLLDLRGMAGMLWQMETNGAWTVHPAAEGTLTAYLAVRLILERVALGHACKRSFGAAALTEHTQRLRAQFVPEPGETDWHMALVVFQLAQLLGWSPAHLNDLTADELSALTEEIAAFPESERRRVYHEAFERKYRNQTFDAVLAHCRSRAEDPAPSQPTARYQVVACIDEREESFRRHLEEVDPECETFGVAGFFGVAMYYRGATEAHFRPLCPVSIRPSHHVEEEAVYSFESSSRRRARARRRIGKAAHQLHVGTRSLAGGILTALAGSLATIPLVLRVLFPRSVALARRFFKGIVTPQATRLRLERLEDDPNDPRPIGFRVEEMVDIVAGILRAIGLTSGFSDLVVIVGHGSSSLNNPHEAAHDCGACGGGRGGPNARAFAEMANDPRVRAALAERGLTIPNRVVFLGAYHNTCDDSMTYYDLDRLPVQRRPLFERVKEALDETRRRNAHERCRRFESASLSLSFEEALQHVEGRAEDLSQTRPEYGHATNAVCFVGRRAWSRGLFLDRRAFLTSYDPAQDDERASVLTNLLSAVIPVCAGINLEYYFSFVDPTGYGCGTKLPHNIAGLLGVMNGAASDLRPGLPWQMVEIHEPMRILFLIECSPRTLRRILDENPGLAVLVENEWVQLATLDPDQPQVMVFTDGRFEPYAPETTSIARVSSSTAWYRGQRDHLGYATVTRDAGVDVVQRVG